MTHCLRLYSVVELSLASVLSSDFGQQQGRGLVEVPGKDGVTVRAGRGLVFGVHAAILLAGMSLHAIAADRSPTLRAEFMRQNPCPATGSTRGACPGYQVDHREALICGGRDELSNLQWLSVAEHKAKTRVEVKLCRPRVR